MATRDLSTNDPMLDPITGEVVVIAPGHSFKSVTEKVSRIVLTAHTPVGWFFGLLVAGGIVMLLLTCLTWLFLKGVGIWTSRLGGASPSSILCGGSVSATLAR
jgi:hypothetical protein